MTTTVKVLNANREISSSTFSQNEKLIIQAQNKVNYQIIDNETGLAPQHILAKREGQDLVITIGQEQKSEPDVVIKNYFDFSNDESTNLLIGTGENGKIYAYVPETAEATDAVSHLAEEMVKPQVLGGHELADTHYIFSPWWLVGLTLVGAGVMAIVEHNRSFHTMNDRDHDGIADEVEDAAIATVEPKIAAAEAAKQAYDAAVAQANANGTYSDADVAAIQAAKEALDTAIANANQAMATLKSEIVKVLPTDEDKAVIAGFEARIPAAGTIPAANDRDDDGITDSVEDAAIAAAEAKIAAAEAARAAYEQALATAKANGTYSQADENSVNSAKAALDQAIADAKTAMETLKAAIINEVATTEDESVIAGFESRIPAVGETITENDRDDDGIADDVEDTAMAQIEVLVQQAINAEYAYKAELAKIGNALDADETAKLQALADQVSEAKAAAQKAIDEVPATIGNTDSDKAFIAEQQSKLDDVTVPTVDEVNDADKDDIPNDVEEAAIEAAEEKIAAAETARAAYEQALAAADENGTYSQADETAVNSAKAALDQAIADAKTAMDTLKVAIINETATDDDKDVIAGFESRIPAVGKDVVANDRDDDGIDDTTEDTAIAAAEVKIAAAEQARADYDKALADAKANGTYSEADEKAVNSAKAALDKAIAEANEAMDTLKAEIVNETATSDDEKVIAGFEARIPAAGEEVTANDRDDDGIDDTTEDKAIAEARSVINAAKAAREAFDKIVAEKANEDGKIKKADVADVQAKKEALDKAIEDAYKAIETLKGEIVNNNKPTGDDNIEINQLIGDIPDEGLMPELLATVEIKLEPITGDNEVTWKEANSGRKVITLKGQVSDDFAEGDLVKLNVNGTEFEASVAADGSFTKGIDSSAIYNVGSTGTVTATFNSQSGIEVADSQTYQSLERKVDMILTVAGNNKVIYREDIEGQRYILLKAEFVGDYLEGGIIHTSYNGGPLQNYPGGIWGGNVGFNISADSDTFKILLDGYNNSNAVFTVRYTTPSDGFVLEKSINYEVVAPTVTIENLAISVDNIISAKEEINGAMVTGRVSGDYSVSEDVVELSVGSHSFKAKINSDGSFSQRVSGVSSSNEVVATIKSASGAEDTQSQDYTINQPTISISVNDITDDNTIDSTERDSTVTIRGNVLGDYFGGEEVELIINNKSYTGQANGTGGFYISDVLGEDLFNDSDLTIEAKVTQSRFNITGTTTKSYNIEQAGPALLSDEDLTPMFENL